MKIELTQKEVAVLRHLLKDADGGWGEPFKDLEDTSINTAAVVKRLLTKLKEQRT